MAARTPRGVRMDGGNERAGRGGESGVADWAAVHASPRPVFASRSDGRDAARPRRGGATVPPPPIVAFRSPFQGPLRKRPSPPGLRPRPGMPKAARKARPALKAAHSGRPPLSAFQGDLEWATFQGSGGAAIVRNRRDTLRLRHHLPRPRASHVAPECYAEQEENRVKARSPISSRLVLPCRFGLDLPTLASHPKRKRPHTGRGPYGARPGEPAAAVSGPASGG